MALFLCPFFHPHTPRFSPFQGDTSCKNPLFPPHKPLQFSPFQGDSSKGKCPISPLKSPSLLPCAGDDSSRKGFKFERNRLVLVMNSACWDALKGKKTGETAGELLGEMWLRRVPLVLRTSCFRPISTLNRPQTFPNFLPFRGILRRKIP